MLVRYASGSQPWLHFTINQGALKKINRTNPTSGDSYLIGLECDLSMSVL